MKQNLGETSVNILTGATGGIYSPLSVFRVDKCDLVCKRGGSLPSFCGQACHGTADCYSNDNENSFVRFLS